MDVTWNIFNGKLPLGFVFRYYADEHRGVDSQWHIFSDILSYKSKNRKLYESNPEVSLKTKKNSFISRELEDDDEGDFEVKSEKFDDYTLDYTIISSVVLLIIGVIIIIKVINCLKKKKKRKKIVTLILL